MLLGADLVALGVVLEAKAVLTGVLLRRVAVVLVAMLLVQVWVQGLPNCRVYKKRKKMQPPGMI